MKKTLPFLFLLFLFLPFSALAQTPSPFPEEKNQHVLASPSAQKFFPSLSQEKLRERLKALFERLENIGERLSRRLEKMKFAQANTAYKRKLEEITQRQNLARQKIKELVPLLESQEATSGAQKEELISGLKKFWQSEREIILELKKLEGASPTSILKL